VKPAFQNLLVLTDSDASVDVRVNEDGKSYSKSPADTYRKTLNWYIGRRPRTAFSSFQVNAADLRMRFTAVYGFKCVSC